LTALASQYPTEGWERYLVNGAPNWPTIALTGQSQGAGMAAFIAKRVALARVILSSSPWDHASPSGRLAPWLSEASATPPQRWYGVYHAEEQMAGMLARAYATLQVPDSHIRVLDIVPNPPRRRIRSSTAITGPNGRDSTYRCPVAPDSDRDLVVHAVAQGLNRRLLLYPYRRRS
jgi:hypothetical protein